MQLDMPPNLHKLMIIIPDYHLISIPSDLPISLKVGLVLSERKAILLSDLCL